MAAMPDPSQWHEPARDVPVMGRPDVLVVGAGSAGVAAALASARRGAETWLIEASSFVGGLATLGLINLLLTMDDGDSHQVVAGLCQEFVDRLEARGEARFPPPEQWNAEDPDAVDRWRRWGLIWGAPPEAVRYSVAFDPEAFIDVAYETLAGAGVRLRLHTWCAGALVSDVNAFYNYKDGAPPAKPSGATQAFASALAHPYEMAVGHANLIVRPMVYDGQPVHKDGKR